MVAATFLLDDDEPVWVGRYNEAHVLTTAAASAAWVSQHPAGAEVIIPHRIDRRQVVHIRDVPQLVGWTETPSQNPMKDCVCQGCLSSGTPRFMRRLRAVFQRGLRMLQVATTEDEMRRALGELETPLERAGGRLPHEKFIRFATSKHPRVRAYVAALLQHCRGEDVLDALTRLLHDDHRDVSTKAMDALLVRVGPVRTHAWTTGLDQQSWIHFVEALPYCSDAEAAKTVLRPCI